MFPDGGSPPRKQNFWASLGTNFGFGCGSGQSCGGSQPGAGTPGHPWTGSNLLGSQTQGDIVNPSAQATPAGPIHTCQYSMRVISLHTGRDINTMLGVSNQSCVHEKLVSPRTFRYLCRKQWTRIDRALSRHIRHELYELGQRSTWGCLEF